MADSNADVDVTFDNSHVSAHHTRDGKPGTHPIAQEIHVDRGTDTSSSVIAYTDITDRGGSDQSVQTESGFDDKV